MLYVRKFNDVTGWQSVTGHGRGVAPVLSKAIAKETFSPLSLKRALSDISSASAVVPFISGSHSLLLCIVGAMIFNLSPGAYYPTANFIALQIKGTKTGIAASVTGFIQTVSAGTISFFAVKLTDTGMGFDRTFGVSTLLLAILSLLVVTTIKVTQWKTGKKEHRKVSEIVN